MTTNSNISINEVESNPITLTVIWNTVLSIAEELGVTLRNTAFSEAVREGDDFATALFDKDAVMIAQGNFSPGHLGSMPFMAKHVARYFPAETLKPGDSIMVNDSFIGAGHFPDVYQIMPVFVDDRLVGYVCCSAHQMDMGGAAPGSQKVHGVTESFQEGLRILPVRFVREGRIDDDIMRILLGNVRVPDKVRGDLLAQHTANLSAASRLQKMFRDYGTATIENAYAAILDRSESTMREMLAKVPAGTYSFEDHMDDYGPNTDPIRMAVDITFDGKGSVEFDFSLVRRRAGSDQLLYQLYAGVCGVRDEDVLQRARAADRRQQAHKAHRSRRLLLQSKISRAIRRATHTSDPHLRHDQRRPRQRAATGP